MVVVFVRFDLNRVYDCVVLGVNIQGTYSYTIKRKVITSTCLLISNPRKKLSKLKRKAWGNQVPVSTNLVGP